MIDEGKRLREYGENVVVKVPMTPDGLKACKSFHQKEFLLMLHWYFLQTKLCLQQNLVQNMLVHLSED